MPFALTSRVWALTSGFAVTPRTRTGKMAGILSPERRSILDFINRFSVILRRELETGNHKHAQRRLARPLAFDSIDQISACVTGCVRSGLHFRTAQPCGRYNDGLLHGGNVGAAQPGLG